jgi:ABC-type antimicrobial peptide transport system permease subunit
VTTDYHSQGLKSKIIPHVFVYQAWNFRNAMIRLKPGWTNETLRGIEKKWERIFPDNYYQFTFLDAEIRKFYQNEKNLTSFLSLFAIAGIVIGCLGLYGLISFVIARRNKEVSVRKVLGARVADILMLLSKEFLQLSVISFLIAVPLSWWLIRYFLADYTYKMDPSWWIFILSGIGAMIITLSTVIIQTLRAAFTNPAKTLRSD